MLSWDVVHLAVGDNYSILWSVSHHLIALRTIFAHLSLTSKVFRTLRVLEVYERTDSLKAALGLRWSWCRRLLSRGPCCITFSGSVACLMWETGPLTARIVATTAPFWAGDPPEAELDRSQPINPCRTRLRYRLVFNKVVANLRPVHKHTHITPASTQLRENVGLVTWYYEEPIDICWRVAPQLRIARVTWPRPSYVSLPVVVSELDSSLRDHSPSVICLERCDLVYFRLTPWFFLRVTHSNGRTVADFSSPDHEFVSRLRLLHSVRNRSQNLETRPKEPSEWLGKLPPWAVPGMTGRTSPPKTSTTSASK